MNSYDQITKNFNTYEARCRGKNCCDHSAPINHGVLKQLQLLRDHFDVAIVLNCGYRCFVHNRTLNSKDNSQHCKGLAVDIQYPKGVDRDEFIKVAKTLFNGVGVYKTFIHLDTRIGRKASWRTV